jgi:hypothetical protein
VKGDAMLTHARLLEVLSYDAATGVFRRLVKTAISVRVGEIAGGFDSHGYLRIRIDGRLYKAAHLALFYVNGAWPEQDVDHKDGVRSNDAFTNLRDVPRRVNAQNQRRAQASNKSSGLLGVSWCGGKWTAQIRVDRKKKHLGRFDTANAAHLAYLQAKKTLHPEATLCN